jgi:hypothetical protein
MTGQRSGFELPDLVTDVLGEFIPEALWPILLAVVIVWLIALLISRMFRRAEVVR